MAPACEARKGVYRHDVTREGDRGRDGGPLGIMIDEHTHYS